MYKQRFGKGKQMKFATPNEYYETLGFLAKSDGSTDIRWENNHLQGAWGPEGRIYCYSNLTKFTDPLKNKFTKGRAKKVLHRINCSEFVKDLLDNHEFIKGGIQNTVKILQTVPPQFAQDFDNGLKR